ncbi:MAG: CHASE3 domain-containing protein [Alphaproteobacteria bacterium]|nr:CHASE3 domain-containing protein [Alphaproteobacteria bacterium]
MALVPTSLLGLHLGVQSEFEKGRALRSTVEETLVSRDRLSALLSLHLDIETGVRGYVLTEDVSFLQPFLDAAPRRDQLMAALKRDAAGDAGQEQILERLERSSERQFALARANYQDARQGRPDASEARIASGAGRIAMDAIRRDLAALDAIERARLAEITARTEGIRGNVEFLVSMLIAGLALLLAGVAIVVGRTTRQRQEALARAEELNARQQALFDGAVDGMLLLDEAGHICKLNPSIVRMFGYDEDELLTRHNTFLMAEPSDLEVSRDWLSRVGAAGLQGAGRRHEFTGRRKDGSTFDTEVAVSRVADERERRYVAAIRDISDYKRAEAMKSEFVSTVSHELRTPLTSIGGSLGLLAGGAVGELNEKAARLIDIAHKNCERLVRLINDILDIEKISSGKMHFAQDEVALEELIRRTIAANAVFAAAQGVSLVAKGTARRVEVLGDADRLEQVLTNLVSNAIKHSRHDGTVEVVLKQSGSLAKIEVRDRGEGIPQEFRQRIFGKFAMADGSDNRTRGGTGLGLSIAREIAQHHGGTVSYDDRPGGGTVFWLELPAISELVQRSNAATDLPRILHVDDDRDCLSVMASAFEDRAAIVSLSAMEDARSVIEQEHFAGAIIDVGMRDEDGTSLLPAIRRRNPGLPVLLFSARDEKHLSAAADAVLIKSRSDLDEVVETMMGLLADRGAQA